jgi:hypothetical protein
MFKTRFNFENSIILDVDFFLYFKNKNVLYIYIYIYKNNIDMSSTAKWLTSDAHAGGSVGILIGVLFLSLGLPIALVKNKVTGDVPYWRKSIGIFISLSGAIALIVGLVYVSQKSLTFGKIETVDVSKVLDSDTVYRYPEQNTDISVTVSEDREEDNTETIETSIFLPSSIKVKDEPENIINLPESYHVVASAGIMIKGVKQIFVASKSITDSCFIFRFIKSDEHENFILMERFSVNHDIKKLRISQDTERLTLKADLLNFVWKKKIF